MIKKLISVLLVISLVISMFSVLSYADDEDENYEFNFQSMKIGLYKTKIGTEDEAYYFYHTDCYWKECNSCWFLKQLNFYELNSENQKIKLEKNDIYNDYNCYFLKNFIPNENAVYCVTATYYESQSKAEENYEFNFKLSDLNKYVRIIFFSNDSSDEYKYGVSDYFTINSEKVRYRYEYLKKSSDSLSFELAVPYNDSLENYEVYCASEFGKAKYEQVNSYGGELTYNVDEEAGIFVVEKGTENYVYECYIISSYHPDSFKYKFNEFIEESEMVKKLKWFISLIIVTPFLAVRLPLTPLIVTIKLIVRSDWFYQLFH